MCERAIQVYGVLSGAVQLLRSGVGWNGRSMLY